MNEPKRVVQIEPGEVLVLSHIGRDLTMADLDQVGQFFKKLGIHVIFFKDRVNLRSATLQELEVMLRVVIRMRQEDVVPVKYCNWCDDPEHPDPVHHPDGTVEHKPIQCPYCVTEEPAMNREIQRQHVKQKHPDKYEVWLKYNIKKED